MRLSPTRRRLEDLIAEGDKISAVLPIDHFQVAESVENVLWHRVRRVETTLIWNDSCLKVVDTFRIPLTRLKSQAVGVLLAMNAVTEIEEDRYAQLARPGSHEGVFILLQTPGRSDVSHVPTRV